MLHCRIRHVRANITLAHIWRPERAKRFSERTLIYVCDARKQRRAQTLRWRTFGIQLRPDGVLSLHLFMFCETARETKACLKRLRRPNITLAHIWCPETSDGPGCVSPRQSLKSDVQKPARVHIQMIFVYLAQIWRGKVFLLLRQNHCV